MGVILQNNLYINKKIALITGANRGLGREIARQLSNIGIYVICGNRHSDINNISYGEEFLLDITNRKQIKDIKSYIVNKFGKLDILINNAGIYLDNPRKKEYESIFSLEIDDFEETLKTNLIGTANLMWEFVPLMEIRNYGRVVNVSSGMARFDDLNTNGPFYRISKMGLNALTKVASQEVIGKNILINSVCPGWIKTEMGGVDAVRDVDIGADCVVWAATLPDDGPSGKFFRDRKELSWYIKS